MSYSFTAPKLSLPKTLSCKENRPPTQDRVFGRDSGRNIREGHHTGWPHDGRYRWRLCPSGTQAGFFEVIAGKSVIEFRRSDEEQKPSSKCFSFVQTFDAKPRRRLWELLKSQGMAENQQVVFLSDGGDSVRNLQEYIHPYSEHWIDWFHITMRITVLLQQVKGLEGEQPELGQEVAQELNSIKHFLWHGNTFQALQRLESLRINLEFPQTPSDLTRKIAKVLGEFQTYISKNEEFIPNFGERRRNGEMISTSFVESTVNQVISKRMVKKQQMRWTPRGAHLLLQIRTKVLNNELEEVF